MLSPVPSIMIGQHNLTMEQEKTDKDSLTDLHPTAAAVAEVRTSAPEDGGQLAAAFNDSQWVITHLF